MEKEQGARSGAPFGVGKRQISAHPAEVDRAENGSLICPSCGFNHAHLSHAIRPYTEDSRSYGWVMDVEGECGHHYRIVVRQYKGQVQILAVPGGGSL